MASQQQQAGTSRSQEFTVVSNYDQKKRTTIMQFPTDQGFDKAGFVTLARENNHKEYKSVYNIDNNPKFGAGSVFGQEAKEEARRKKFGYTRKTYHPEAQPWLMQIGAEKNAKKFKGTRNGGILENASYFIFTKNKSGMFEAVPVEEWHSFKPTIKYNNLNAEEAEEEFARRDKNLNMFNIMLRKKIKKEGEGEDEDSKEKVKSKGKGKGLMLTEMEDWADLSDEDGEPGGGNESDSSINGTKMKGKGKGKGKGRKKKKDQDTDDEAVEDSDDGDAEAKQVDYMSDTSESDSDAEGRADKSKYEEKGVEDETGLRDIVVESDDEKDDKKEETAKKKEKGTEDQSSSSSESESDDPDRKDDEFTKAFLMTGSKKDRGKSPVPRSATPTNSEDRKRKQTASPRSGSPSIKKVKAEPDFKPITTASGEGRPSTPVNSAAASNQSSSSSSREGVTEENVRRYLSRKPMSSKDLSKQFKYKKLGMSNEEFVVKLTAIIKKINPTTQKINGLTYFSIKE